MEADTTLDPRSSIHASKVYRILLWAAVVLGALDWLAYSKGMSLIQPFNRPDLAEGCIIAFRRPQSAVTATAAQLQGMDAQATYEMEDLDEGTVRQVSGAELAGGLSLTIDHQPGTKLLVYRRQ